MTKTITVNGKIEKFPSQVGLIELLTLQDIDVETVKGIAVAVNEKIVRRTDWANTPLVGGERVEIVTARQGG